MLKFLLTNDDGIDAPGLHALWASVHAALADRPLEVTVVAPDRQRSECGHSVTTGRPLAVCEHRDRWFAVDGTPVDCVRVALATLAPDATAVLSGVNSGANLGIDLAVSGTFAAAREAAISGIPAAAVSHYRRPGVARSWEHVTDWTRLTLQEFVERIADRNDSVTKPSHAPLWNVNLPAADPSGPLPDRRRCGVDPSPLVRRGVRHQDAVTFEVDFHGRPRRAGLDVDQCFSGFLTISELSPMIHDAGEPWAAEAAPSVSEANPRRDGHDR